MVVFRLWSWSDEGNLFLKACHIKILILGGMRALQRAENRRLCCPSTSLRYRDLTEKHLDAVRSQEGASFASVSSGRRAARCCQSLSSTGDRVRRKPKSQPAEARSAIDASG